MRKREWIVALGIVLAVAAATVAQEEPAEVMAPALTRGAAATVVLDGHVSRFEYEDATTWTFQNAHGTVNVYAKAAADGWLYFAFELPNPTVHRGDDIVVMLDTKAAGNEAPGAECTRAYVRRKSENSRMQEGDGKAWKDVYGEWEYASTSYEPGWEVEARIPLAAIGADGDDKSELGLALRIWDDKPQGMSNWPADSNENKPNTWARLTIQPAP